MRVPLRFGHAAAMNLCEAMGAVCRMAQGAQWTSALAISEQRLTSCGRFQQGSRKVLRLEYFDDKRSDSWSTPWIATMKMFFLGMMVAYTPSLIILTWALRNDPSDDRTDATMGRAEGAWLRPKAALRPTQRSKLCR